MKSLVHWGNSEVTGRGVLVLAGKGQVYSIDLKAGEQYIAHPRCDFQIVAIICQKLISIKATSSHIP